MSIPSLLDALAARLIGPGSDSSRLLRARKRFSEHALLGNTSQLESNMKLSEQIDPVVALNGIALGWEMAQRFDHSIALRLLLDRLQLCLSLPNAVYSVCPQYSGYSDAAKPQLAFTEQTASLRLLYTLYTLQSTSSGDISAPSDLNCHRLTKYADDNRKAGEQGSGRIDQTELGWFFASPSTESSSRHSSSRNAHLSINDTSFDTIWSHLLSSTSENVESSNSVLKHPVFSSSVIGNVESPLDTKPNQVDLAALKADPTQKHRLDALGSLFGALRFPHPSLIIRSSLPSLASHSYETLPSMRMDISDDRIGKLELPKLPDLSTKETLAPWVSIQAWKPQTMLPEDESKLLEDKEAVNEHLCAGEMEVVSKRVTVAEFLERTWHGAAGPLAPWQRLEIEGAVPVEEDALEWKDRLVYRARLLNAVSAAVVFQLQGYHDHINSLFTDSIQTANALCGAFRRFLNFWRGELLFSKRPSLDRNLPPPVPKSLEDLLPPLPDFILADLDRELERKSVESAADDELKDFFDSFHRVVSTSGSCTQILHLHQLLNSILEAPTQASRWPVGAEAISKLAEICIATEQDPILTRGISRQILSLSLVPLAKYLSEWLFWGTLPSHREFLIEDASSVPSPSSTVMDASKDSHAISEVDSFTNRNPSSNWLSKFIIKSSHVPSFLRPHVNLLLKTGALVQIDLGLERIKPYDYAQTEIRRTGVAAPVLRPIWRLSDLYNYYRELCKHIGSSEEAVVTEEEREMAKSLRRSGCDDIISVEKVLEDSFVVPIQLQFDAVSPRICRRLVQEWKILDVIERLKGDYFGVLVTKAFEALPLGVDLLDGSSSSHTLDRLRVIFAENIQGSLKALGYRLALERIPKSQGIDVLDNIFIEPTFLQWPYSILITPDHIEQYNKVFVLLTKMTRARSALNSVWSNLSHATRLAHSEAATHRQSLKKKREEGRDESIFEIDYQSIFRVQHQASIFCHQLEHFWAQLYSFMVQQVQFSCFHKVKEDIEKASHFEELVNTHQHFINAATKSALLDPNSRALLLIVEKTIHLVHKFRQQIRYSLADPSKWEIRARKQPLSVLDASVSLEQSIFGSNHSVLPSTTAVSGDLNTSVFEQANYQPDELETLVTKTRGEFEGCMKFLTAVLLKLLQRGYEPHMAALLTSINYNKFYFTGPELMAQGQS